MTERENSNNTPTKYHFTNDRYDDVFIAQSHPPMVKDSISRLSTVSSFISFKIKNHNTQLAEFENAHRMVVLDFNRIPINRGSSLNIGDVEIVSKNAGLGLLKRSMYNSQYFIDSVKIDCKNRDTLFKPIRVFADDADFAGDRCIEWLPFYGENKRMPYPYAEDYYSYQKNTFQFFITRKTIIQMHVFPQEEINLRFYIKDRLPYPTPS